jgi:hypothetical protein
MVSSSILTYEQGIRLLVEILFFVFFYFIYLRINNNAFFFTDLLVTSLFFGMWVLTVTLVSNLVLALQVNMSREAHLTPYS